MNEKQKMTINEWVSLQTDAELRKLSKIVQTTIEVRERERKERRSKWIRRQLNYLKNCEYNYKVIGETVVLAMDWYGTITMTTATPVKGDVFDLGTGLAVAFAKMQGECIPSYI